MNLLDSLRAFRQRNRSKDLSYGRLLDTRHLDALSWEGGEREKLLSPLRAVARLAPVERDPERAYELIQEGLTSAHRITSLTQNGFIKRVAGRIGAGEARSLYQRAQGVRTRVLHHWMRSREAASPYNRALSSRAGASTPQAGAAPAAAPGLAATYAAIFAEAATSDIPHDASIIGPGAYLADLLSSIERTITELSFDSPEAVRLSRRRPDLQNLLLTPANATDEISNVDLILEVLESTLCAFGQTGATVAAPDYPPGQPALTQVCSQWPHAIHDGAVYCLVNSEPVTVYVPTPLVAAVTLKSGPSLQTLCIATPLVIGSTAESGATSVVLEGFNFTLTSQQAGTMIEFLGGSLVLRNCLFTTPGSDVADGWVIRCAAGAAGTLVIENCTFIDTGSAPSRPAIAATDSGALTLSVLDCLVWPTAATAAPAAGYFIAANPSNAVTIQYSDLRGGQSSIAGGSRASYGNTNFDADPLFDPARTPAHSAFLYSSPCIGRGSRGQDVGATFDLYATLAWAVYPAELPFDLPFVTGQMALAASGTDLGQIDRTLGPLVAGLNRQNQYFPLSRLGIGLADAQILANPVTDAALLAPYFGLPSSESAFATAAIQASPSAPMAFVAQDFATWLGLTPDSLRDLIYEDLSPEEIAQGIQSGEVPSLRNWNGFYVNGQGSAACNTLALVSQLVPIGRLALEFNSASQLYVAMTLPSPMDSFTVTFWLYVGGSQTATLATVGPVSWQLNDSVLTVALTARGKSYALTLDLLAFARDPQWVHIATVYDSVAQSVSIYANGQPAGAPLGLGDPGIGWVSGQVTLGAGPQGVAAYSGLLCELTIWSLPRPVGQINSELQSPAMAQPATGVPDGLLIYIPANDGGGATAREWVSGEALPILGSAPTWIYVGLPSQVLNTGPGSSAVENGLVFAATDLLIGRSGGSEGGVTLANLDRINRFTRLARRLTCSYADLEWALFTLFEFEPTNDLTPHLFAELARIRALMLRMNLGVPEICALFGPLKPFGCGRTGDTTSFFDQIFNRPPLSGATFSPEMSLTLSVTRDFVRPGPIAGRLAALLNLAVEQLVPLVRALAPSGVLTLTGSTLTALYRYRTLAGWLSLDIDSVLDLLSLTSMGPLDLDLPPSDFELFLTTADWISRTRVSPTDLRYLTAARGSAATDPYQRRVELEITQGLAQLKRALEQDLGPLRVGPQSFISPVVDEAQSLAIYADARQNELIDPTGIITADLWAQLPQAPFRVPSNAYKTIGDAVQAAVTALNAGAAAATVLISPGTHGNDGDRGIDIALRQGVLTLQSESDPAAAIIDCGGKGPFLTVTSQGDASVILNGLTIRNGARTGAAGGAIASQCTLELTNCFLLNNSAQNGGAIYFQAAVPAAVLKAENCVFYGNTAVSAGGALYLKGAGATLYYSTVYGNQSGGGTSNGAYLDSAQLFVSQSILWDGPAEGVPTHSDWDGDGTLSCDHSDINTVPALPMPSPDGCIGGRPGLLDPANGLFTLGPVSPCRGTAQDGSDMGFGGSVQQDLTSQALFPFAYAQIAVLQKHLARFFKNDSLPFEVVLEALGPYQNGLEILLADRTGPASTDYLREVYRYLLLANLFGLDSRTLRVIFAQPTLLSLTATGTPPVPSLRDLGLLSQFSQLAKRHPDATEGLLAYLSGAASAGGAATLSSLYGWSQGDLEALLQTSQIQDFLTAHCAAAPGFATATLQLTGAAPYCGPLTLEAWISSNTVAPTVANVLIGVRQAAFCLCLQIGSDGCLRFTIATQSAATASIGEPIEVLNSVTTPAPLQANTWYHVAGVFDAGGATLSLYLNGQLVSQAPTTIAPVLASGNTIDLGQAGENNDPGSGNSLAEVRIWSTARTGGQLLVNLRRRIPQADPDFSTLLGYWTFEAASVADLAGFWVEPALSNPDLVAFEQFPAGIALSATSGQQPACVTGQCEFTGDPPYSTALTVEAWISTNRVAPPIENVLLGVRHINWSFVFVVLADGTLAFQIGAQTAEPAPDGGAPVQPSAQVTSPTPLAADTGYHIAAVFDAAAATLSLYIDGQLVNQAPTRLTPGLSSGDPIYLGQDASAGNSAAGFNNSLAEVRLWSVARTQEQIQARLRSRIPASAAEFASLCGYWTFAEGNSADLTDHWNNPAAIPHGGVTFSAMPGTTPIESVPFATIAAMADALWLSERAHLSAPLLISLFRNGLVFGADGAAPLIEAVDATDPDKAAAVVAAMGDLKRNALKRFAIPQINAVSAPDFPVVTDDNLSDYLLLDVNMGAGTSTSRIVQATLSLQQYIQRCRLGLEPGAAAPNLTDKEWEWLRTYRTWEANRKVFLYPETYLRPELRNDKTPLFVELEQGLANSAITPESLERLYRRYLDHFAVVANLEIVGSWFEPGSAIDAIITATSAAQPAYATAQIEFAGNPPYSGEVTVEAWISTNTVAPLQDNVLIGAQHLDCGFSLRVLADGTLRFKIGSQTAQTMTGSRVAGQQFDQVDSPDPLVADTWYHAAAVFDGGGGTLSLYLDGQLVNQVPTTITPGLSSGDTIFLGQDATPATGCSGFSNSLAEVRLWNVARTQDQIQANLRDRIRISSPDFADLCGYWPFADGNLGDLSGYWTHSAIPNGNVVPGPMLPPLAPTAQPDLYYFIGRSRTQPPTFYCRSLQMRARQIPLWSAWESMQLSINAAIATPVVSQGRLSLFWVELRKIDAIPRATVSPPPGPHPYEHYRAIIKYSTRQADGSWLAAQAPFPAIELPATEQSYVDPYSSPAWQQVYAAPTTNQGFAAIAVIYGPADAAVAPYGYLLNWDQTVTGGQALAPDPALDYAVFGLMSGPTLFGLWALPANSVLSAMGLAAPTFRGGLLSCAPNGTVYYQPNSTNPTLTTWVPPNLIGGTVCAVAAYNGSLYATVQPASGQGAQLWQNDAPFTPAGHWVQLNQNILPPTSGNGTPVALVFANGHFYCAVGADFGDSGAVLAAEVGALDQPWLQVASLPNDFSWPSLTVTPDGVVYCFYPTRANTVAYTSNSAGTWSTPSTMQLPQNSMTPTCVSNATPWRGQWYLVVQFGDQAPVLLQADAIMGPWTACNTQAWPGLNWPLQATPALSANAAGLYFSIPISDNNQSTQQLLFTPDPSTPWTSVAIASSAFFDSIQAPIFPPALEPVLPGMPPGGRAVSVHNQLASCTVTTEGAAFLVQALDPLSGAVLSGQLAVTVSEKGQLGLAAQPPQPPDLMRANFRVRRLSSSAVQTLSLALAVGGVKALLSPTSQRAAEVSVAPLLAADGRTQGPDQDTLSFALSDAYGMYYREIFCFIPWLIAEQLQKSGAFRQARDYLEYIFKPSAATAADPRSCWQSLWLRATQAGGAIQTLEQLDPAALAAYHDDPFDATAIADLRPTAYQRAIVTAYVQNLIAWGDDLFTQNTRETINEADLLYRYAAEILGPRPRPTPYTPPPPRTYGQLATQNENEFLTLLESLDAQTGADAPGPVPQGADPSGGVLENGFYFGVPDNPEFLANWDLLDDRLYKIRNGLDITGKTDTLALFDPPLSVTDIQRLGRSGGTGVADTGAAEQLLAAEERFLAMLGSARTLASLVMDYGRSLQQALEMKDADGLFMLQTTQQSSLAGQMRQLRIEDVRSAQSTVTSLQAALQSATSRRDYYRRLIESGLSATEQTSIALTTGSLILRSLSARANALSVPVWLFPEIFGLANGGAAPGAAVQAAAATFSDISAGLSEAAGLANVLGGYERRAQDWQFQQQLAEYDITQMQAQVDAVTRQLHSAQMQFDLQEATVSQARAVQEYYTNKFANGELYSWLADTLSALYQQLYQIALSSAQTAQAALASVTGVDQQLLAASGWNAQWRGLLAGEALQVDLARMEQAFNQWQSSQPTQVLEKDISLRQLAPEAYLALLTGGQCVFDLGEALFDRDHPGYYLRRISGLRLKLPGLSAGRRDVNMAITCLSHDTVRQADPQTVRFLLGHGGAKPGKSLRRGLHRRRAALFHVPLADGREQAEFHSGDVHAFDGSGVASRWQIEIPRAHNRVDIRSIRDVEITVRYQARYGGDVFRREVEQLVPDAKATLLFDVARDFPASWAGRNVSGVDPWHVDIQVDRPLLPRNLPGRTFRPSRIYVEMIAASDCDLGESELRVRVPWSDQPRLLLVQGAGPGARSRVLSSLLTAPVDSWPGDWRLQFDPAGRPARLQDLYCCVEFDEVSGG